jgi:hypothetical protein
MKLHRIYTENKNLEGIKKILNRAFESYTLLECVGIWKGTEEKSLIIEVLTRINPAYFELVADDIKDLNQQQAVLVTVSEIESSLI